MIVERRSKEVCREKTGNGARVLKAYPVREHAA